MAVTPLADLKAELQARGVRPGRSARNGHPVRRGGAGPAEGITLLLNGSPASVPFSSGFVSASPFVMEKNRDRWALFREGRMVDVHLALMNEPSFYREETGEGVPLR